MDKSNFEKLGMLDSIAVGILQRAPFYMREGWPFAWAERRLQPVFDRLAEKAFLATVGECAQNPEFKNKTVTVTLHEVIENNAIMVDGVAEWGLSFEGSFKSMLRRFVFQREVGII